MSKQIEEEGYLLQTWTQKIALPMFRLNAPSPWWWLKHSVKMSAKSFTKLETNWQNQKILVFLLPRRRPDISATYHMHHHLLHCHPPVRGNHFPKLDLPEHHKNVVYLLVWCRKCALSLVNRSPKVVVEAWFSLWRNINTLLEHHEHDRGYSSCSFVFRL